MIMYIVSIECAVDVSGFFVLDLTHIKRYGVNNVSHTSSFAMNAHTVIKFTG